MGVYERVRQWSYIDVLFFSIMVGIGESYVGAFALEFGFSERFAGLLAVVPLGLASFAQLFSNKILHVLKSRRRYVVLLAVLQAACLFALIIQPTWQSGAQLGLMVILSFYWFFGLSAGPAWNAWVVSFLPIERRNRFFSERGRIHEASLLVGLVSGGLLLYWLGGSLTAFSIMFAVAGTARLLSAFALYQHPEETDPIVLERPLDMAGFRSFVADKNVLSIIAFLSIVQFGVSIGSPFFTPFMLKQMQLSYELYMFTLSVPFISRVVAYGFSENLVRRLGLQLVMLVSLFVIAIVPALWAVYPQTMFVLFLQVIAGFAWAMFEYCVLLRQINDFPQEERSRVLIWLNLMVGLFSIAGVGVGSLILGENPTTENYTAVFTVSTCMRFVPLVFAYFINWQESRTRVQRIFVRLVGLRVSRGGLSRPVLYTEEPNDPKKK